MVRVEYLETTTTQYILLPPIPNGVHLSFAIEWYVTTPSTMYVCAFGSKHGTVNTGIYTQFLPAYLIFDLAGGTTARRIISSSRPSMQEWHHAEFINGILYVDDVQCSATTISDVYNQGPNTYSYLGVFGAYREVDGQMEMMRGRIAYFTLWYDGELAHSLVPVRIGKEGFMYDEVDGTLYGNAGTGQFVLGADL